MSKKEADTYLYIEHSHERLIKCRCLLSEMNIKRFCTARHKVKSLRWIHALDLFCYCAAYPTYYLQACGHLPAQEWRRHYPWATRLLVLTHSNFTSGRVLLKYGRVNANHFQLNQTSQIFCPHAVLCQRQPMSAKPWSFMPRWKTQQKGHFNHEPMHRLSPFHHQNNKEAAESLGVFVFIYFQIYNIKHYVLYYDNWHIWL